MEILFTYKRINLTKVVLASAEGVDITDETLFQEQFSLMLEVGNFSALLSTSYSAFTVYFTCKDN